MPRPSLNPPHEQHRPAGRRPALLVAVGLAALGLAGGACAQAPVPSPSPALDALAQARAQGCGGRAGIAAPWRRVPALDDAARRVAAGAPPLQAAREAGYRSRALFQVRFSGYRDAAALAQAMRTRHCQALMDPRLTDAGLHRQGDTQWVLLSAPFDPPSPQDAPAIAAEALRLVNEARARPRRCGDRSFDPAPPLRLVPTLERAASAHAQDMARRSYLEHRAPDGSTPGDRATRAGYAWQAVGENIASGVFSAREAVDGWLHSPGHCANLMQPNFTEMGLAFSVNADSEAGIYWAQTLARPRQPSAR